MSVAPATCSTRSANQGRLWSGCALSSVAEIFAAQYQQQPVAPGGAMIKRSWVRRYDQLPKSGQVIQSWDVANKQGEENDYSVCTTWLIHENRYYLIDVLRGRFDFPTLRTKVSEHAKLHKASQHPD